MTASTTISMYPVRASARATDQVLSLDLSDENYATSVMLMLHGDPQDIARKLVEALMPIAYPFAKGIDTETAIASAVARNFEANRPYRASGAGVAWEPSIADDFSRRETP